MTDPSSLAGSDPAPAVDPADRPVEPDLAGQARERLANGLLSLVPVPVPAEPVSPTGTQAGPLAPDLALIDPARLDVMFDPANLRRPLLPCVLDRVSAILGGPALLQTPRMLVMERAAAADAGPAAHGDDSPDPVATLALRPDSRPEDRDAVDRAIALGGVSMLPARGSRPRRVLVPIRGCGELLGFLVATVSGDGPWPRAVASRAARTLALIMMVSGDALAEREHRRAELFGDLLAGAVDERLPTRAVALGHDLARLHRAYAFAPDCQPEGTDADGLDGLEQVVLAACRAHRRGEPESLVGRSEGRVLAFVPLPTGRSPEGDPAAFARQVIDDAAALGLSVSAGVGSRCRSAADFPPGAGHAVRALAVLEMTGRTGVPAAYDDLGVYGLLVDGQDHQRLDDFVRQWIGPLLDYDRDHNTELARTLGRLFDEPTLAEAADALFVHTSTLKYRVKRIEEILGMPIRDPRAAFHLQLATAIHRVRSTVGRVDGD